MTRILAVFSILILLSVEALAETASPSQASPQSSAQPSGQIATPEVSRAWCAGWASAVNIEKQRFDTWANILSLGRSEESKNEAVWKLLFAVVESLKTQVLIQPINTKVTLGDGTIVDCTPREVPSTETKP